MNNNWQKLSNFFSTFSDPTRLKILSCLSIKEMCVNDLSIALNINQTTISHQLKTLKLQNFVYSIRSGKIVTYSLSNNFINEIMLCAIDSIK